jgi:uncharacterized protein involved in exopolysaccharide biosynthesis/MinD-like ATPase involved in chromosome partitioning or flagellar assembly
MISLQTFRSLKSKIAASVAVFVVVTGIGWVLPLTPPASFDVQARLWVQTRMPTEPGEKGASNSIFESFMTYFNSPILTACEVLKSGVVLDEAVRLLKSKHAPGPIPAPDQLRSAVRVEPVRDTDIVSISYTAPDATVATEVVQAILDAFASLQKQQASFSAVQSKTFLQRQLVQTRDELKKVETQIREFQNKTGLIDIDGEVTAALKRRETLQDSLKTAEMQNSFDQAKSKFLGERLGIAPGDADKLVEAANDPPLVAARREISELEFQYQELGSQYRPEHPRMRQLRNAIAQLKVASQIRAGSIAEKVPITSAANGGAKVATGASDQPGTLNETMLRDLITARADEQAQAARQAILHRAEQDMESDLKKFPDKQLEFANLLRAQKVIYDRISELEQSLNSAQLVEAVNTSSPNFRVIDEPSIVNVLVPSKRPKILTAALLGLVLGVLTFFGLDWLDPRLRRISTVIDTLPLPVLGWTRWLYPGQDLDPIHRLRLGLRGIMNGKHKHLVVISSDRGDGKTSLAAGLAQSFAQVGKNVLLIDSNIEHPTLHERFRGVPPVPGLADYLANPDPQLWLKIAVNVRKNLRVIPAGRNGTPGGLLGSDALPLIMKVAESEADVVIYDTPATSESTAALGLLSESSVAIIVVRLDHTHLPSLRLLGAQLKQCECHSAGLVLANVDDYAVASVLAKNEQREELEPA